MPHYLPICLNLAGRRAVIVGGGSVGTQKALDLAECGAEITVVSPRVSDGLRAEAAAGRLTLVERAYRAGDITGAFLVVAATDDPETNVAVFEEGQANGQLVNVCDDPEHCSYIFASRVERGPLTVSIFTHGASPALSRRVRRELEVWLGPEYTELAELLAELRPEVKAVEGLDQPDRQRLFERIVYSEALLLFREGCSAEARALAERIVAEALRSARGEARSGIEDEK